jgi:hypothetical protein
VVNSLALVSSLPAAATSSRLRGATGCLANPSLYPGAKLTDCVALSNNTVAVDHTVVLAKWSLTTNRFGFKDLCAAVSITNQNKSRYFFNDFNMTLRPPQGSVRVLNFTAKDALNDGFIPTGGRASGNICFDYFGQSGEYVAMYTPHPRSSIRGIWIIDLG